MERSRPTALLVGAMASAAIAGLSHGGVELLLRREEAAPAIRFPRPRAFLRKPVVVHSLPPRAHKGSVRAKRATARGGNPARSSKPRLVEHHFDIATQFCRRCSRGRYQIENFKLRYCEGQ